MGMEPSDGLKQLLTESCIELESERARGLLSYLDLLKKWNLSINLTAATEWAALKPLFQEGIWASKIYPAESESHLDIGSGAGFPAVILRILRPHIRLEMVESRTKKAVFLEKVIQTAQMHGTLVHTARLGVLLGRSGFDKVWDCVTWKGLKLKTDELQKLRGHAHAGTQFWMFHGSKPAVEEPIILEQNFRMTGKEEFPGKPGWYLSKYVLKAVDSDKWQPALTKKLSEFPG